MKDIITTLLIMLTCITALACEHTAADTVMLDSPRVKHIKPAKAKEKATVKYDYANGFISPISVQLLTGTQGIGADIKYGFLPKLSGRLGFGIIPVDASRGFGVSSLPVEGQLSTRFSNVHLLADYSPFNSQGFRIVGGAAYLIQGNANVIVTPQGGYTVGDQSITKDQFGVLTADVTWKGVAPYLGVAFFRSFPNRLFNMNLDLGTYYLSSPGTSFTGTKLLSDNDVNAKQFNQNMQGYRWLPVIQLNFNFRIK